MDQLRISLVQFDIGWEEPVLNRLKLDRLLEPLSGQSDLILLPEMFTTGFSMKARELAETMEGESVAWMKFQAKQTGSAIAGSLIIEEGGHYYNRFLFVTPTGQIDCYDKRHLFSMGDENHFFKRGERRMVVQYKGWRIALFICYDLRFPVWCRTISDADLVLFSANWPESRKIVWQTLVSARAIENQLYVAAVNRTGTDGSGVAYMGASMVVDPRGAISCMIDTDQEMVKGCILSLDELCQFRKKFPIVRDEDIFTISC